MVLCTDARNEDGPKITLTQPAPSVLRCEKKLYKINKECSFSLRNCIVVNPQPKGLYTMFYIADGTCDEIWHDRLKPEEKAQHPVVQQ
jgi:hypothetical protein